MHLSQETWAKKCSGMFVGARPDAFLATFLRLVGRPAARQWHASPTADHNPIAKITPRFSSSIFVTPIFSRLCSTLLFSKFGLFFPNLDATCFFNTLATPFLFKTVYVFFLLHLIFIKHVIIVFFRAWVTRCFLFTFLLPRFHSKRWLPQLPFPKFSPKPKPCSKHTPFQRMVVSKLVAKAFQTLEEKMFLAPSAQNVSDK